MNDCDALLARIAAKAAENGCRTAPVTAEVVAEAERRLGFRLHPLPSTRYRRIGDGSFGPMDALLPLDRPRSDGVDSVVGGYLDRRARSGADDPWAWPAGVVPVLDRGCAMVAAVDRLSEDGTVLLFEPNAVDDADPAGAWFVDADGLAAWLEAWLCGTGWYEEDVVDEEFAMAPWKGGTDRG
ncbi:SMI1/KNR4 family protein [Nocardiopsis aegyptia]|uniref:SMI1/KNR4 family protein n=1 Tax=Nocardiopsis aegyptia TaxID=220378 RepID=A0A7Z0EME4_9ACTN|nr:SMI1/KNR4 family protein [Nocardiopsis aegyptia]NYJ34790.1 hypothetical protein [Nocardiopsis aegyptia]